MIDFESNHVTVYFDLLIQGFGGFAHSDRLTCPCYPVTVLYLPPSGRYCSYEFRSIRSSSLFKVLTKMCFHCKKDKTVGQVHLLSCNFTWVLRLLNFIGENIWNVVVWDMGTCHPIWNARGLGEGSRIRQQHLNTTCLTLSRSVPAWPSLWQLAVLLDL